MSEVTYGRLDKVLRTMGFTCRAVKLSADALVYEHPRSEAVIILPPFPEDRPVMPHHMIMVRTTLDGFGIADPTDFAAELQKAG